ncbi:protein LURP-one-related 7 isoform X3 [Populus trichocarpa]|uniref:protein LURP-one-related 7 isoform X3 n=1 Tax=Populus trichocarpa TaxID=3694 RepID=UPI002278AAD1|nr:protein LURP-one-related 7 isoform X3 [Populus trichocarpa]
MASWAPVYPAVVPIPVDLFVSKKHPGLNGDLGFADSLGNIVFKKGSWQGFKGGDNREKDLIFRVKRTVKKLTRTELEVFLVGEISRESTPDFKVKGFPFQRSCTIYRSDSIVAQTSLMYKLHQIYARRSKYRLTIFPGSVDHSLIASLIVIFLYGQ